MSDWELNIAELNGSSHGDTALFGHAPAPRVGDFGDQSVSVTAVENAGHLSALAAWIGDVFQVWRILELASDVGIGESPDHVLAVEKGAEDLSFIAG